MAIGVLICLAVVLCLTEGQRIYTKSEQVIIPQCANISLHPGQYSYSAETRNFVVTVGFDPLTISNITLAANMQLNPRHDNMTVCYPLSPQLFNCPAITLTDYKLDFNLTLSTADDQLVNLGDYYVDPQGQATFCSDPIRPMKNAPRCNYVTLNTDEIHVQDGGSWKLNATGDILFRPELLAKSIDQNNYNVCWPLTIPFVDCPVKWVLEPDNFKIGSDHRLDFSIAQTILGVGDYVLFNDQAIICRINQPPNNYSQIYTVYTGFFILSTVCLILTVIYQLMAPKLTYHTRCLLCHVVSMCVMYIALTLRKHVPDIPPYFCYGLYVVTYVATLSAFFWLNVLAFDVWQFFSSMQTARFRLPIRLCMSNRFFCYSLYAWGMPVLICILSVVVDKNRSIQKALDIYPGIPSMCWFNERKSLWVFYYSPLAALMFFNLIYFVFTVLNLRFASNGTEIINRKRNKQLFVVCLKLFVVMGLSWLAEIFTWAITRFTSLQGVAIFIVYTAKKENFENLRRKICPNSSQSSFSAFPEFSKAKLSYSESAMSDITSVSTMSLPDALDNDRAPTKAAKLEQIK